MAVNDFNETLRFFVLITGELILLFIGVSFLIGVLREYVSPQKIKRVLSGNRSPLINNTLGVAFEALTPFCSCSTIPITLGLLNGGAQFGSTMSFLIASPLLNPVILSLLITLLGIKIAAIYFLIVFPAAVLIGYIWDRLGFVSEVKDVVIQQSCCCDSADMSAVGEKNMNETKIAGAFWEAWSLFKQMLPWLLVGAGVGALIYGFIPEKLILKIAGPNNPFAIPAAAVIGVPMYIRAATMLPITNALLSKGMGIGAVMALIIGGAGASIPEVSLLAAIFKKKLVIAFVITVWALATLGGFLFSLLT